MLADDIHSVICRNPGLTATQIAMRLYGDDGYHARVAADCRFLAHSGRVERRGAGGPGDPYTYYPSARDDHPSPGDDDPSARDGP